MATGTGSQAGVLSVRYFGMLLWTFRKASPDSVVY